ncbi:MAG: hypothetical protein A2275_01150 [Bacteroidetes bacterium RIFOXYA12_FULL_35_11]|nr:MAG: hypothetical protein A2X01_03985 [Bacteroidetes bacterium GWF2_35_48]OFY78424.1 MAG: hypothetical protein A2275_01150 [Bacteroidetes bacterium RIFOXYA12_FULL_35_11]OFY93485.1 MAG: hypothetical protein A2491_10890 [Bacteroidetes bacterium RIFOXYC12_FULL_35_7]HBX50859.1 helicase [Bacteroidales bacterium]
MEEFSNTELKLANEFVEFTDSNVFLTGKAGTGKTTFLHTIKKKSPKRMIVVAPTGVAAINAGGVTIHSFFQLPFGPIPPADAAMTIHIKNDSGRRIQRFGKDKIRIIRSLDLLVIDEISMVRADLLDGIDSVLRRYRDHDKAFGGVQLLMIGDLQQLSPVVKDDEWQMISKFYETPYFFSAIALKKTKYITIELNHIYRQSEQRFIDILNKVRENKIDSELIQELNKRHTPGFDRKDNPGYITLTTHNAQSNELNSFKLKQLPGNAEIFEARVSGDFPEHMYPSDFSLYLKKDAQVMFIKNDSSPGKLFYNGKIGKITRIEDGQVFVKCPEDYAEIDVKAEIWDNTKYTINEKNKEITEESIGKFEQLPLKLAWAITIHKSQGLTFEKVIIDARAAFAFGQVYVALSRCRTFEGIVLSTPLNTDCIKTDRTIEGFSENARNNQPTVNDLVLQRKKYEQELVFDLFDFTFLQKNFYYVFKQIRENHTTLHISFIDVFARMEGALNKEIIDVSAKFRMQLREIFMSSDSPEKEDHLQERVKKAAAYFEDKIKTIILQPVFENEVESDNKAIRTQIKKNLEQYYFDATVKYRCLEVCKSGFIIKLYLNTRAKAFIENINPLASKAKAPKSYASEREVNKPAAYSVLKAWRDDKADIADVPHYNILSQKVLLQLAVDLPVSKNEFLAIKGFGKHKYAAFGDELTEIILPYRIEKNPGFQRMNVAENDDYDLKVEEKSKKQPVGFSQLKSLELFNEGKSIPEIAAERQMVVSTIEGHLAGFIATGELEIHKFMETEKVSRLSDFIIQNPVKMNEVKAHFKDEFSYSEIRFVIKHLEFLGKKETRH